MIAKTVKVSSKGQIAIPREIREKARIVTGDELLICERDGQLFLEKLEILTGDLEEDIQAWRAIGWQSLRKIWENPDDEAFARELEARARRAGILPVQRRAAGKNPSRGHRVERPARR